MSPAPIAPAAGPRPLTLADAAALHERRAAHLAEVETTCKTAQTMQRLCDFMDFQDCIVMMMFSRFR